MPLVSLFRRPDGAARYGLTARLLDRLFGRGLEGREVSEHQAGAIPYTVIEGQHVFLLVTSRGSGRWIFPKGGLMEGLTAAETAAAEALEEAGVEGLVGTQPLGRYRDWKIRGLKRHVIEVEMYALRVERQHDDWIEKGQRSRHWATLPEARRLLGIKPLTNLAALIRAQGPATSSITK